MGSYFLKTMKKISTKTAESYIAQFPPKTQKLLKQLRATIKKAAPKAVESISYGMVGYKYPTRPLVYFGGFAKHVSLFATPSANEQFLKELGPRRVSKGTVQFPLEEKLPIGLITKMVAFRVKENIEKEKIKKQIKK